MLEFLFFTFTNIWTFLGVTALLMITLSGLASIIRAFWGRP